MTYDLRSLSLPRLGTRGLRALVAALEAPLVGPWLVRKLRRDAGIDALRTLDVPEPPTFLPAHPPDDPAIPALVPFARHLGPDSDAVAPPPEPPGFRFPSVADYHAAYRTSRLTPEDVASRCVAQWQDSDSGPRPLRAFITVQQDDLARQARASTERWKSGRPLGPWDGVPVAIKDEIDVSGYETTLGTRVVSRRPATADATVVARLRAAGALIVGKANMHELGINVTGLNPHYGTVRNPYDDGHHSGGSSSGPAAAVAAGLVPVAIGADGGGSIRIPSAFCGVVGIKPTFGRVSEHGAPPLVWSVAHFGPIAASVRDCAAAYALIAGDDPCDANSLAHPSVSVDTAPPASLHGLRVGIFRPWFRHASIDVVDRCERLVQVFAEAGAIIVDVDIPELDLARVAHVAIITGEMAAAMAPHHPARRSALSLDARANLAIARSFSAAEYVSAARIRTRALAAWRSVFRDVHVVLTPATGITAPRIDPRAMPRGGSDLAMTTDVMRFAFAANLTGHPAVSFPAGYDSAGLPVGLQAIGRPWSEQLLFRFAAMAERSVERRAPARWHPTLPT
ncbi:MAG TPA: amidase [Gemmatimonadaceae bacterium]|nr:amidase [Gemmatimonadaceae bacterium]